MRKSLYHLLGVKISFEDIYSAVYFLGYKKDDANTTDAVYYFRNGKYHLKIIPHKSRVDCFLHIDIVSEFRDHVTITSGDKIKKIEKSLIDLLD